jgi:hypothetical protein
VPQHIVFTPDAIGLPLVAFCVQYRPSLLISGCIVVITVITKILSLRDIRSSGREIAEIKRQSSQQWYMQSG